MTNFFILLLKIDCKSQAMSRGQSKKEKSCLGRTGEPLQSRTTRIEEGVLPVSWSPSTITGYMPPLSPPCSSDFRAYGRTACPP